MTMTTGPRTASESMRHRLKRAFDNPLSTYYIIAGSTLLLLVIGVVMVTSASSIESFRVFGSAYTLAQRQGMFAIIGVFVMF
ncbi:MAG: putative lipid II flippase FtsW, partial [Actinobacteria bacterium]|nr:putative lipid II flippase FtsW [Actinomycetota bacterium]